ncbi:hypothetical protein VTN02DRAFT_819 [Thermoascus thermophilus]
MIAPASPSGDGNYTSNDQPRQSSNELTEVSALIPETCNGGSNGKGPSRKSAGGTVKDYQSNNTRRDESNHLDVPLTSSFRPSTDSSFSDLSVYAGLSAESRFDHRPLLRSPSPAGSRLESRPSAPPLTWRARLWAAWLQSKGLVLVMLSQFFGASMNVMTRVLEINGSHGEGMNPFQILLVRMSITALASYLYMWYAKVPAPFGIPEVRMLLVLRAVGGFFGVFGIYYAMLYMPLSEATVLTFLAPIVTCYACSFLMPNEPFTRKQQLAALVSLLGVVLIARPFSAFGGDGSPSSDAVTPYNDTVSVAPEEPEPVDSYHHMLAIVASLLGVLGAACAYTAIRWIGKRAHALVSVTYFSAFTTLVSIVAVLALPSVSFRLPGNLTEWSLLLGLGVCGFFLQFLMTAGLAYVPPPVPGQSARTGNASGHGSRATSMVYTQMLFALFYDKVVWDSAPSAVSWAGSGLILGSAIYIAVVQESRQGAEGGRNPPEHAGTVGAQKDIRERDVEEGTGLLAQEGMETGGNDADWSHY